MTSDWKLENNLCRCCHSEGLFKNLAETYVNFDEEETYTDMLQDCLNINLAPVPGMLCTVTYTICDACVIRLRDAFSFRRQVLDCEKRFHDMYSRNVIKVGDSSSIVEVKEEKPDTYTNDLKVEFSGDDGNDDDFDDACEVNYDDDDEDSDTLETVKKKITKPRKSKQPAKKPTTSKVKEENTEASATKVVAKKKGQKETDAYYILKKNEDGTKLFTCTTCSRSYKTIGSISQHYRHVHLRQRPKLRSCYLCDIKVPAYARAFHLEKEHGMPAPTCGACGKKFAYPFQVLRHQKIDHMGEKKYKCEICDRNFATHSSLEQHGKIHTAIKDYKCSYCEKAFRWRKNLRTHIMMHENDRRQVCQICHEAFVQQSSLKYHMTKKHPESM